LSYFPYRGQTGSRSMQEQQKELRIWVLFSSNLEIIEPCKIIEVNW
jgi:hypothetical protein